MIQEGLSVRFLGLGLVLTALQASAAAAQALATPAPAADHHQHLFSPQLAAKINGKLSPDVTVPADLRAFLDKREAAWNSPERLAPLLADEVETVTRGREGWIKGRDAVAKYLGTLFARQASYAPTQITMTGNRADLAGYVVRGVGADRRTLGYFQMSLVREGDAWRMTREVPIFPFPEEQKPITAADLIRLLDAAGIRQAQVLSEAFWWDSPALKDADPLNEVRAENEWTAQQAALYPDRLSAFCSFNPLADHALSELERCAADRRFKGLKFSFAMSGVDLTRAPDLAAVQAVFAAAGKRRLPIVVHLSNGNGYGADHARLFVDKVLPLAADSDIQVAHLWGGEGFSQAALDVLVDAVERRLPGTERLTFDTAEIWTAGSPANLTAAAAAIRRIGIARIRYGSDGALNGRLVPADAWRRLRFDVPLSDADYARIAATVAPALPRR